MLVIFRTASILVALVTWIVFSFAAQAQVEKLVSLGGKKTDDGINYASYEKFLSTSILQGGDGVSRLHIGQMIDADRRLLRESLTAMTRVQTNTLNPDAAKAYWINLYNLLVIDILLENWPVDDIRTAEGGSTLISATQIWGKDRIVMHDVELSLDDIEHEILRPYFRDPRIHFALALHTFSSPYLLNRPYRGKTIDDDLDEGGRTYVNRIGIIRARPEGLVVPTIFQWYQEDFGNNEAQVILFLSRFAEGKTVAMLNNRNEIGAYEYDWKLIIN